MPFQCFALDHTLLKCNSREKAVQQSYEIRQLTMQRGLYVLETIVGGWVSAQYQRRLYDSWLRHTSPGDQLSIFSAVLGYSYIIYNILEV